MDKKVFKGSLYLVIYTIGYSVEGESIVIFIKTGDIIVYSIVIDGYKVKDCNITHKLLLEKGIEHIDVFCWTHPNKDHSIGIEEYIPFIDKEALIIIGDGFLEIKEEWQNANEKMSNLRNIVFNIIVFIWFYKTVSKIVFGCDIANVVCENLR